MESLGCEELVALIRKHFDYDPAEGVLIRKLPTTSNTRQGDVISIERHRVSLWGKAFPYATLCWVIHYGTFPNNPIDHKNRLYGDNRIENLREATPTQNQQNKAGYGRYAKGVTWRMRLKKPFQAKIRVNGERIHLGSFATEEEAAQAYRDAAFKYHGEFACPE